MATSNVSSFEGDLPHSVAKINGGAAISKPRRRLSFVSTVQRCLEREPQRVLNFTPGLYR
jgi:hypothetical protein